MFCIFLISVIQELLFWFFKPQIFDWNPETKLKHLVYDTDEKIEYTKDGKPILVQKWVNRVETYKSSPPEWKFYRFSIELTGIFVGWNLIFFSINTFSYLRFHTSNVGELWNVLLALILGLIGIFGRIPVIIDSVQDWFKR